MVGEIQVTVVRGDGCSAQAVVGLQIRVWEDPTLSRYH